MLFRSGGRAAPYLKRPSLLGPRPATPKPSSADGPLFKTPAPVAFGPNPCAVDDMSFLAGWDPIPKVPNFRVAAPKPLSVAPLHL